MLFSGTIDSNLRYGRENATREELEKAAAIAQATEFIEQKEEGMESPIAQEEAMCPVVRNRGCRLQEPLQNSRKSIFLMTVFSALDFKTDAALRKALKEETEEATTLIVAQRISTILHADRILVLDEGKVVGMGTHKELLQSCEVYQQIARSQLSQEELDYE